MTVILILRVWFANVVERYYYKIDNRIFGIDLGNDNTNGHNGIFYGKKVFGTSPRRGMFLYENEIRLYDNELNNKIKLLRMGDRIELNKINQMEFELE